jgi:tRNA modification GTPase
MDTICALSSGAPPSGVAVIRISGPKTLACVEGLCGAVGEPRKALLRVIRDPATGEALDEGLVLWMPGPSSFTGEDCAEFQCHGSRAVVDAIIAVLTGIDEVRLADAGEFSRRAFDNGKLDLTELEGLADLIQAETEAQRRQAALLAQGAMRRDLEAWRKRLINLRAEIEARLDFVDEDDVSTDLPSGFFDAIRTLRDSVAEAVGTLSVAERVRHGLRVALIGAPNSGKSTLLNRIARRDVAIVTEVAGTTRDVLEVPLDLGGYPVVLFDTAGLRETENIVEQEGIRRARLAAEQADLVLWLRDLSAPEGTSDKPIDSVPVWTVWTKADLVAVAIGKDDLRISAVTGEGLERLLERLRDAAHNAMGSGSAWLVTRERQARALGETLSSLEVALADGNRPLEMVAEDLRSASDGIGRVIGRVDVEDVLDQLFSEFCIGK